MIFVHINVNTHVATPIHLPYCTSQDIATRYCLACDEVTSFKLMEGLYCKHPRGMHSVAVSSFYPQLVSIQLHDFHH